jgi:hypothetical protein
MSGISSGKKWDHPKLIQNFVSSATGLLVAADVLSLRVPLYFFGQATDRVGRVHNWVSPVCSRCGNRSPSCPFCFQNYQRGIKRGQCQHPGCTCRAYSPLTDQARPVNKYAGRLLYRKRP